ncbi:ferredoxin [Streptomyces sp. NPDC050560]|uniref:ferredoxin n=1 Tax=Streptomyces sp. NPDC050560 TaxID=3365630 RepID=UPI0037AE79EA
MRVASSIERCEGFASCLLVAPDVFELGPDDRVLVLDETPGEEHRAEVEEAVRECPVRAIWIADEAR